MLYVLYIYMVAMHIAVSYVVVLVIGEVRSMSYSVKAA